MHLRQKKTINKYVHVNISKRQHADTDETQKQMQTQRLQTVQITFIGQQNQ